MNIEGIKQLAKEGKSPYFFDNKTLDFFQSIIFDDVRKAPKGWLFITSEVFGDDSRHYQVRHITKEGVINYWGNRWDSYDKAKNYFMSGNSPLQIGYDPTFKRREHIKKRQMLDIIGEDRI
tara:strand:+ start:79 stop:441 length:363 start_codon:yes stop_codon:yes gene_type:complete